GTPVLYSNQDNHTLFDAQTTAFAAWGDGKNADFFDGNHPTTITPHLTVKGGGTGDVDYYSINITDTMLARETDGKVTGTFDIDHGFSVGDRTQWGSQLRLFKDNDAKTLLSVGRGWSAPSVGGAGSDTW